MNHDISRRTFAPIDVILAFTFELIGAHDVTGSVWKRVDCDPFAIAAIARSCEMRELARRVQAVRIGVDGPSIDADAELMTTSHPVDRWYGTNRYDTAVRISQRTYTEATTAVVATGDADEIGRLTFAFEEMRRTLRVTRAPSFTRSCSRVFSASMDAVANRELNPASRLPARV